MTQMTDLTKFANDNLADLCAELRDLHAGGTLDHHGKIKTMLDIAQIMDSRCLGLPLVEAVINTAAVFYVIRVESHRRP